MGDGDGLHSFSAEINRDPKQYASTNDAADGAVIELMVGGWGLHSATLTSGRPMAMCG